MPGKFENIAAKIEPTDNPPLVETDRAEQLGGLFHLGGYFRVGFFNQVEVIL